MTIHDTIRERIISIMNYTLEKGMFSSEAQFYAAIGVHRAVGYRLKIGENNFTVAQINDVANLVDADMNYIFGRTNKMFAEIYIADPIEMIEDAVRVLKLARKSSNKSSNKLK